LLPVLEDVAVFLFSGATNMHTHHRDSARRIHVLDQNGAHFRWVNAEGMLWLTRNNLARTFGTARKVHGLLLLVTTAEAVVAERGRKFLEPPSRPRRRVSHRTYRELVGGGYHLHQLCGARL
jgi:hypothetical protein